MKVTVFNGSPRGRNSNSHRIVDPLLEGARRAGAETEEIFLVEHNIEHCRGCFDCWGRTPGMCVIDDDMSDLIDLYLKSDYVGLATPVYGMYMTGLLKNFLDRFLPLAMPHIHKSPNGSFYHKGRVRRFPQKFLIANSGFPGDRNFDLLKTAASQQGFILEVYRNCGEALSNLDGAVDERISGFYDALREAGRELVSSGGVSQETIAKIHAEIVSDDEYMRMANQHWDEEIGGAESKA